MTVEYNKVVVVAVERPVMTVFVAAVDSVDSVVAVELDSFVVAQTTELNSEIVNRSVAVDTEPGGNFATAVGIDCTADFAVGIAANSTAVAVAVDARTVECDDSTKNHHLFAVTFGTIACCTGRNSDRTPMLTNRFVDQLV